MKNQDSRKSQEKSGGDVLQALFQHASARERPSAELERAARDTLSAEWRQIATHRKRRRQLAGLALAASVLVAVGFAISVSGTFSSPAPAIQLAVVEKQAGRARILADESAEKFEILRIDSGLMSRQVVETGPGSVTGLLWIHGQSIRLDENTRVRLESSGLIRLDRGRMYVDTAKSAAKAETLLISTPAGLVRHVGTRYMTVVSLAGTTLSVRSGKVMIDLEGIEHLVSRGEQINVGGDGQRTMQQIETWGEQWQWAERSSPTIDADGKTIAELIDWVAGETGHTVEYASSDAERQARNTIFRGQLELEPMKALSTITQTSGMDAQVLDGRIVVSLAQDA